MDLLDSILKLQEKYDDPDVVVKASDIKRPQSALDREMFEDANKRFNQADGGRIGFSDGSKTTMVRDGLDLLPKGSKVAPVDLANQLQVSRSLVDKVLKEKKYKNKFNVVRKLDSLSNQEFIDEYKNYQKSDKFITGEDKEFAQYLNDQGFKAEKGDRKFNEHNVALRRRRLNIDSVSPAAFRLSDDFVLKEAKRFKIDTKGLSLEEIRSKVLNKRQAENLRKKREADPELDERLKKEAIKRSKKQRKRLKSTEEGRAILREQRRREKQKRYLKEGLDPPANSAKEMLWKDTVKTAKEKSRFNIVSGYKKSMKKGDYYSDKIKIKDSITGKTFTFNTIENFINKNAGSFNIKNYEEVIRPYKQKQYINDKGLRNTLNEVLIPGWSSGDPRTAYTIQHEFGRKVNPFKVSLAFYDDNSKEYKIRSDFEKAWEKSKTSKTPLADKKLAFNTFKKDIDRLNIRSSPSMITRDRAFGKELDLKSILQKAKKEGAVFKRGTLKKAAEFDKQILNNIQSYSKLSKCKVNLKADGGRIGFANSIECIQDGLKEQKIAAQQGNKKAARELVQVGKVATRAGLLKNLLGPGALLGEAVIEGAIIGNKVLGGTPADIAYAESYLSYLDPRKYRGELDPLKMAREDMLTREVEDAEGNIKTIAAPGSSILKSGFAAQDQLSAFNKALQDREIAKARGRIDQYNVAAADAREQGRFADQSADIISSDSFKDASRLAQEYLQGQTGANIAKYRMDDFGRFESGGERDLRRRRMQEMKDLYPQYSDQELINMLEGAGYDPQDVINQKTTTRITPAVTSTLTGLDQLRTAFQQEEAMKNLMGGAANFAGGGIAKIAGVDQGPPPESGPNSQGLQGLMKRVKNL